MLASQFIELGLTNWVVAIAMISSKQYKQKHLGCKKVRGQSEAACKQAGVTKALISAETKKFILIPWMTYSS